MQRRKYYKKEDKWGKQKTNSKVVALIPIIQEIILSLDNYTL